MSQVSCLSSNCQKLSKLSKIVKNRQICQKLSKIAKIVKKCQIVKKFPNCQESSNLSKVVKNCHQKLASIKCHQQVSQNAGNQKWLTESVTDSVSDKVTYWAVRWQLKSRIYASRMEEKHQYAVDKTLQIVSQAISRDRSQQNLYTITTSHISHQYGPGLF